MKRLDTDVVAFVAAVCIIVVLNVVVLAGGAWIVASVWRVVMT